ncbi:MAG: ATP-binding protein, partial [Candidatus Natronoplasma sp.]
IYGRRTGQLKLKEMPISALKSFLPSYSHEDLIRTYGALGAIPFYLKEFDDEKEFFKNVETTFFNNLNILYEEAEILLREELRKPNVYFNMIKAIIDGATKLAEISSKSHVSVTNVNKYLNVLDRLDIIEREYPVTEGAKKKNFHYRVTDNYFRFWLSFVYPNQGRIEDSAKNSVKKVKKDYAHFMGPVFEEVCRMYVKKNYAYEKVGKWWYKENEIDVVGLNDEKDKMLLGECKWSKKTVGQGLYYELKEKEENVRWKNDDREVEYMLFSRSSFDENLRSLDDDNLSLVDLKDLWHGFER